METLQGGNGVSEEDYQGAEDSKGIKSDHIAEGK
jgi:hypothetical protein